MSRVTSCAEIKGNITAPRLLMRASLSIGQVYVTASAPPAEENSFKSDF
ncbi:MAG TPA: hypothetical protein VMR37_07790 [Rhabdochlamydiaceae bacterium]|nr:hypothetical protein [Rhabdochlamydiaceae bacterium]